MLDLAVTAHESLLLVLILVLQDLVIDVFHDGDVGSNGHTVLRCEAGIHNDKLCVLLIVVLKKHIAQTAIPARPT